MRRSVLSVALMVGSCALQAQTFDSFKAQCVADQRAACAAGKWWRTMTNPAPVPIVVGALDDAAGYPSALVTDISRLASYVCGTVTYKAGEISSYTTWVAANPGAAVALVSAAARIDADCSAQARQMVLVQQMLEVAQDNQQTLKGDIQAILGKLIPGATVTITLPPAKPPKPASAAN